MSGGFDVDHDALSTFSKHLDGLAGNLQGTGDAIGGCVADPGIFGVVGQLFGAGASDHCAKARDQFGKYADSTTKFRESLDKANTNYQNQETEVADSILGVDL